jgi:hypothetical protein
LAPSFGPLELLPGPKSRSAYAAGAATPRLTTVESGRGVDQRLRAGAIAFVLAALMNLPVLFAVHPPTDPGHNREFALGANTLSYRLAWSLQVYALTPVILGMFALYATLAHTPGRRWAMAGLILTVCGACFVLVGGGFAVIVVPAAGLLISQATSRTWFASSTRSTGSRD